MNHYYDEVEEGISLLTNVLTGPCHLHSHNNDYKFAWTWITLMSFMYQQRINTFMLTVTPFTHFVSCFYHQCIPFITYISSIILCTHYSNIRIIMLMNLNYIPLLQINSKGEPSNFSAEIPSELCPKHLELSLSRIWIKWVTVQLFSEDPHMQTCILYV